MKPKIVHYYSGDNHSSPAYKGFLMFPSFDTPSVVFMIHATSALSAVEKFVSANDYDLHAGDRIIMTHGENIRAEFHVELLGRDITTVNAKVHCVITAGEISFSRAHTSQSDMSKRLLMAKQKATQNG